MAGMHLHLNSEDQALLKVVELAIAEKGQGAVAGDGSIESLCYKLAAAAPVSTDAFRDSLLAQLQSTMSSGVVAADVDDAAWDLDARSEIVDHAVAVVPPIPWRDDVRTARPKASNAYKEHGGSAGWMRQVGVALTGVAAVLVLFLGLSSILGSQVSNTFKRISSGLAGPSNDGVVAAEPTATTGGAMAMATSTSAMSEPTGAAIPMVSLSSYTRPSALVTPVDSAASISNWSQLYKIPVGTDTTQVEWSSDSKYVAIQDNYGIAQFFDLQNGTPSYRSMTVQTQAKSMAWAPSGKVLARGYADGSVDLLLATDTSQLARLAVPQINVDDKPIPDNTYRSGHTPGVMWSPDGTMLASVANVDVSSVAGAVSAVQAYVYVWDLEKPEAELVHTLTLDAAELARLTGGNGGVSAGIVEKLEWSPVGRRLAVLYGSSLIALWDADTGNLERTLYDVHVADGSGTLFGMSWSANGQSIAQPLLDQLGVWDVSSGQADGLMRVPDKNVAGYEDFGTLIAIAWSPRDEMFAMISGRSPNKLAHLSLVDTGSKTYSTYYSIAINADVLPKASLAWSPDAQVIAYTVGGVALWSVASKTDLKTLQIENPQGVWWSPDGSKLAVLGDDGLEIWGVPPEEEVNKEKEKPPP